MSKKILFIEDESALQRAMGDMLKSHGYEVIPALNGEIGEHLAESEQPALILLDLVIPQKDGYEILSELQKNPATKAIPIIVLTNLEGTEEIEKALSLGARTYLVKARYTLEEVITKVKSMIGE